MDGQDNQKWVDAKKLAEILGVKQGWIRQNMKIIPHKKLRRLVRFNPVEVMERFKPKDEAQTKVDSLSKGARIWA